MQELRYFEHSGEHAVNWQCGADSTLRVLEGRLWLTVAGDTRDYWLRAGDSLQLRAGSQLWISAHPQARFEVRNALQAQAARRPAALGSLHAWLRGLHLRPGRDPVYG